MFPRLAEDGHTHVNWHEVPQKDVRLVHGRHSACVRDHVGGQGSILCWEARIRVWPQNPALRRECASCIMRRLKAWGFSVMTDVPDDVQRLTAKRKTAVVLSIAKREASAAEAARKGFKPSYAFIEQPQTASPSASSEPSRSRSSTAASTAGWPGCARPWSSSSTSTTSSGCPRRTAS